MSNVVDARFINEIKEMLDKARRSVNVAINVAMVYTYYEIGKRIVEQEQKGANRAEYGKEILKALSGSLSKEYKRGYSERVLWLIRQFYVVYSSEETREIDRLALNVNTSEQNIEMISKRNQIWQPLVAKSDNVPFETKIVTDKEAKNAPSETNDMISNRNQKTEPLVRKFDNVPFTSDGRQFILGWSHYVLLIRIKDPYERRFYEIEAYNSGWSKRELVRQYDSSLYERLKLSRDKDKVLELSIKGQVIEKPEDAIKDPLVLNFLKLKEETSYTEKELERRIIDKLQDFLLELGKGFTFVGRQKRLSFDDQHFYPDLVFYNRILRSFVIIDLKIGNLSHQDIGQMQMYVNYYDRHVKLEEENKTIGILLCKKKNNAIVEMTLPEDNNQIFATQYETILPSKEELKKIIEDKW